MIRVHGGEHCRGLPTCFGSEVSEHGEMLPWWPWGGVVTFSIGPSTSTNIKVNQSETLMNPQKGSNVDTQRKT